MRLDGILQQTVLFGMGRLGRGGDDPPAADDLVARHLRLDQMVVNPGEGAAARQAHGGPESGAQGALRL